MFSRDEETPNFFESSNIKWYGDAVPAVPIDMALGYTYDRVVDVP